MKVATIVPQNYLKYTRNDDYFMCLANLLFEPGYEKYTDFFRARALEGKYVIMDNGLIEGNQRPIEELLDKANKIGASEMILTDVFMKKDETLEAIRKDMEFLENVEHPNIMMVPQGSTADEWVECAHQLCMDYNTKNFTLGIPKVLTHLDGRDARVAAIYRLAEVCPVAKHRTVHLLGCYRSPLEILVIDALDEEISRNLPKVRGVDSALPFVFARAGRRINQSDRPDSDPIDFKESKVNTRLLKKNIREWKSACSAEHRGWRRFF